MLQIFYQRGKSVRPISQASYGGLGKVSIWVTDLALVQSNSSTNIMLFKNNFYYAIL